MINERGGHIRRPILTKLGVFASHNAPPAVAVGAIADLPCVDDTKIRTAGSLGRRHPGSRYTGDDGTSHFLNWIGIDDPASGSLGHPGEASAGQAVMMSPGSEGRSRL
jgi:hypothetical protein